jgi:hypothetical protein
MARGCSIPCNINGVEGRIRRRALNHTLAPNVPLVGLAVVLAVASVGLVAVAPWQVALVAALFFVLGAGIIFLRGVQGADEFTRLGVPAELDRIIDEHEAELFPARVPELRARAARLTYDSADYRTRVTQFLQELRAATGEAWRCPCRKRRLPIPLPF